MKPYPSDPTLQPTPGTPGTNIRVELNELEARPTGTSGYFAIEGDYTANVVTTPDEVVEIPFALWNTPIADEGGIAHIMTPNAGDTTCLVFDQEGKFFVRLVGEVSSFDAAQTYQRVYLEQSAFTPQKNEMTHASRHAPESWVADGAIVYIEADDVGVQVPIRCAIGGHAASWDWFGIWVDKVG